MIRLNWDANQESDLAGYEIFRGGDLLGKVSENSYEDTGLTPSTEFCYSLRAYDTAGNRSAQSTLICATTLPEPSEIFISPISLDFGKTFVGSCKTTTFIVQHVSGTPASGAVEIGTDPSPFTVLSGSNFSVSDKSTVDVTIQFCPTGEISYFDGADITTDANTVNISSVGLSGIGILPLKLSMTASPDPVVRSGMITYQLQVSNVGDMTLTDVLLEARMPDINGTATSYGSWITGGGSCSSGNNSCFSGQYIIWPVFTLGAGETKTVSFDVQVNSNDASVVPDGTIAHVEATASYGDGSVTVEREVVVD